MFCYYLSALYGIIENVYHCCYSYAGGRIIELVVGCFSVLALTSCFALLQHKPKTIAQRDVVEM